MEKVEQDGFALLPGVFSNEQVEFVLKELGAALARVSATAGTILGHAGGMYAARNVLTLWPAVAELWHQRHLLRALAAILGPDFGLVRVLFFDKPPEQSWALPWHKDLTVAVRENRLPSDGFRNPTRKAGVPHAEAPLEVLQAMLTARLHLDDVTDENGPLRVIPGSHCGGKELELGAAAPRSILARRGDVLLMRPLLAHCSNRSHPGTSRHRRVLHLEFAASPELPDGYAWHTFLPAPRVG
jgi:ectoine hydroxylase-related dioxygenase (phytanoyl-CoA dioxygenase family)